MATIKKLEQEIIQLKNRNERVETDKAWETSWTRRILITLFTYLVIVIFFLVAEFPKPLLNAIVPTVGFVLSTLSLRVFKRIWVNYRKE